MCIVQTEEENSVFNTALMISRAIYTLNFTLLTVLGVGELVVSVPISNVYDIKNWMKTNQSTGQDC